MERVVGCLPHVVRGLGISTIGDLVHRRLLGDLLAAEPPVVFIRVVLQVIEAQIGRGFALSHPLMLTPSCSAVPNAEGSLLLSASKCGAAPTAEMQEEGGAQGARFARHIARRGDRSPS